jgi:hypothetical protein
MSKRAVMCTGITAEAAKVDALPYAKVPGAEIIESTVVGCEFRDGAGVPADMDHLTAGDGDTEIYVAMVLYDED